MPAQRTFDVHPRLRQSRLAPERLHDALRAAGRGRVMAPVVSPHTYLGSVNPGAPGGEVTSYDPTADRPGSMVYVQVNVVQCGLNAHGARLTADGVWGPRTAAALADFVALALLPVGEVGASGAPAPPATLAFVAPSAGSTSVKMSPYLKTALLDHTDVASCVAAGSPSTTAPVSPASSQTMSSTTTAMAAGGPPTWLYVVVGVGAAIGLGAWAMSASKKRKRR
jgi:hypothetical protein